MAVVTFALLGVYRILYLISDAEIINTRRWSYSELMDLTPTMSTQF